MLGNEIQGWRFSSVEPDTQMIYTASLHPADDAGRSATVVQPKLWKAMEQSSYRRRHLCLGNKSAETGMCTASKPDMTPLGSVMVGQRKLYTAWAQLRVPVASSS